MIPPPGYYFLCETKKKKAFVQAVTRKLKGGRKWESVDPIGLSGGLLLGWSDQIKVTQVVASNFCFEMEFEDPGL